MSGSTLGATAVAEVTAGVPAGAAGHVIDLPERLGYRLKRRLLGPPLVTARLHTERLSKRVALGVLSSDCISSSAYGTEEMLIVLLGVFGLAGFTILMPLTAVVLAVLAVVTLSYREVVMVYARAGGSYVVARENFGPRVAQIAAVALLIDYVVTVAVQAAAGTAAITSADAPLARYSLEITIAVVLLLAYGNLRGIREAGRMFSVPTYLFVAAVGTAIVAGIVRVLTGSFPTEQTGQPGQIALVDQHHALLSAVALFYLLKAFANGGSSLTGLEAISNGVSAFKPPTGANARRTLSVMSLILGVLVLGVSFLAWRSHATPYASGTPTVISQVAHAAFGPTPMGHVGFVAVQAATALILYTGANTPFTGFPFLASFVADDAFLPRQLARRGHRLAFSNGIITLTALAVALLLAVGARVDRLVPFYAIGVFTGFAMAGFGMAHYHRLHREPRWRHKLFINFTAGLVSAAVVVVFAVTKFGAGAWLVVVLFPTLWLALTRLNARYRRESRALDIATSEVNAPLETTRYPRHTVFVLLDRLDLAVLQALRYAETLRPTTVRAVHVAIDVQAAARLRADWVERGLADHVPLELLACPDRRLTRAVLRMCAEAVARDAAEVTVVLPRRSYGSLAQRLLHDRTADRIATAVSRLPHVVAAIVPYDMRQPFDGAPPLGVPAPAESPPTADAGPPARSPVPLAEVAYRERVTVQGRIESVEVRTGETGAVLVAVLLDDSGGIELVFFGRTGIPGIEPGAAMRARGCAGLFQGRLAIVNPRYELLSPEW